MRTPFAILSISLLAVALVGCNASTQPSASPSSSQSTSESPAPHEPVPTGESQGATLAPVAKPSPKGGPWTNVNVTATSAAQIESDQALPDSLRAFLGSRLGVKDASGCTLTRVEVKAVHPDGYAFGTEDSDCGAGQHAIWGIADSQWSYIVAFEDAIPCSEFVTNEVPKGLEGLRCLDDKGKSTSY